MRSRTTTATRRPDPIPVHPSGSSQRSSVSRHVYLRSGYDELPRPGRLRDLTPEDLEAMRAENETLFVEHKSALREPEQFNVGQPLRSLTAWAAGFSSA
jgi:hypothetical protein